mgnify:CR=1 FL=1
MEGILGVIGTVLGLILWWLKHRDSPEAKRERLLVEERKRLDEDKKVAGSGSADDILRRRDDILRQDPDLHAGGTDKGDERP